MDNKYRVNKQTIFDFGRGCVGRYFYRYKKSVAYDANGNIKTYLRNGDPGTSGLQMDDLTYQYERSSNGRLISNKLRYVGDEVRGNAYEGDIKSQTSWYRNGILSDLSKSQASDNYHYDNIGNLIKDQTEKINQINWTVYGKIGAITKNDAGNTSINYGYDAGGNRISKVVQAGGNAANTFYVRDAQGNVMGVYTKEGNTFGWREQHLYGSSRIGILNLHFNIESSQVLVNDNYTGTNDPANNGIVGLRAYELSNHLGNVLSTISDKKVGVDDGSGGIDYYIAEVLSQNDYYPFGQAMPGRKYSASSTYRYGFNGKENDNEVKGEGSQQDYGLRIYDTRLVRFLSVDPLTTSYPWYTPYQFAGNKPIEAIDLDGAEEFYQNQQARLYYKIRLDLQFKDEIEDRRANPLKYQKPAPIPEQAIVRKAPSQIQRQVESYDARKAREAQIRENIKPANLTKGLGNAAKDFVETPFREFDEMTMSFNEGKFLEAAKHGGKFTLSVAPYVGALKFSRLGTIGEGIGYRAINSEFAESTLKNGFFRSGFPGRLGNDGIYANTTIEGAIKEFSFHNPGMKPAVFEVKYPLSKPLSIDPPSGYFNQSLPFTQGANILKAPSVRAPGTENLLIRQGDKVGNQIQ